METKIQTKLKNVYQVLFPPTRICKVCFKKFSSENLFSILKKECDICPSCQKLLKPKFIKFKVLGYKAISIYSYDENLRNFIYLFKGCYDIELKRIFFERYINLLRLKYRKYIAIPAPSNEIEDEKRGFNHVCEMFDFLNIPILKIIKKGKQYKQASEKAKQRGKDAKSLVLVKRIDLTGKKVLIIDDVFTTGSTVKAMINIIKKLNPKRIEILVASKTILKSM